MIHLVEWAIVLHGTYESAFVFISILKQKNLSIVGCEQCIWDVTAYFLLSELKYYSFSRVWMSLRLRPTYEK
jgi:hypothetical protein